jgi:hypothetical protein
MPKVSEFRSKLNARLNHVIDSSTQKLVRELLDYAEGLERRVSVSSVVHPIVLLGPKEIPGENDGDENKKLKTKTKTAQSMENSSEPKDAAVPVLQPTVILGPKEIPGDDGHTETSNETTLSRSGDSPKDDIPVLQPVIILGPKAPKPVKKKP